MAFKMTWLADVLRAAGLTVTEIDGWKDRGRGDMGEVRGILCHHTGGPRTGDHPSLDLVLHGRPDLAGPLSQLVLGRCGTFFVLAAGRCNHAGAGLWQGVTAGNSSFIGIEAENAGVPADSWPPAQLDAYIRGCAAILKHLGADSVMVAGHKEYALPHGRKIDPLFDMEDFRAHVANAIGRLDTPVAKTRLIAITVRAVDPAREMLRKGSQGPSVEELQRRLGIPVDGGFGPKTELAVEAFQVQHGLVADGRVGPATWNALGVTNSTEGGEA